MHVGKQLHLSNAPLVNTSLLALLQHLIFPGPQILVSFDPGNWNVIVNSKEEEKNLINEKKVKYQIQIDVK